MVALKDSGNKSSPRNLGADGTAPSIVVMEGPTPSGPRALQLPPAIASLWSMRRGGSRAIQIGKLGGVVVRDSR